jgi:hypothetical protein
VFLLDVFDTLLLEAAGTLADLVQASCCLRNLQYNTENKFSTMG